MLYPDFNELVALEYKIKKLVLSHKFKFDSVISGNNASMNYGSGLDFAEVRRYEYGDDIRNIDWRVTARTNKVHSKLFKIENEQIVNIAIDMNSSMHFGTKSTFKSIQAAKSAALMAWLFNKNGDRVGGIIFGGSKRGIETFLPSKSKQSLLRLFKSLSRDKIAGQSISIDEVLLKLHEVIACNSVIYVISDFMNLNYAATLKNIKKIKGKRAKINFIQVVDRRDYEIPPMGLINFSMGNTKIEINTDSEAGRRNYFKIWQDNQKRLENIVKQCDIRLLRIDTSEDVYLKLLQAN